MTVFPKIILSLLSVLAAAGGHGLDRKLDKALRTEMKCVRTLVCKADSAGRLPRTTDPSGKLVLVGPYDWTSGFFPGILWELYGLTGDSTYRSQARKFTGMLSSVPEMKNTHDLGFMVFCSYGHQYAADRDEESKKAIIKAAESLYSRYDEKIGL
ncbi:MAG: glycoside hydrolase family 88 protein, partial [Bacteroidales bacterium]|nr:glycoside hydrolase family 88 protein [Bacteroidales bacterium]